MYSVRLILTGMVFVFIHLSAASQQLKLGNNPFTVQKSAVLDMESTNQGLLMVRITDTTLINALTPPDGMVIYFVPTKQLMLRTNNAWQPLSFSFTRGNLIESGSGVLTITGGTNAVLGSGTSIQVQQASGSQSGYLSSTDWNTFNGKGTLTSVGLTSSDITVGGAASPITTSGTYTLTLPTINSNVGTFNNVTVNGKGQVTAASNAAYLTGNQSITWTGTGDVSGTASGTTSISPTLTLATVNSNVGSFGTVSSVPAITVNGKGLVTAAANTSIQIAESQVTNLTTDLAAKQAQLNGTGFVKASGTTISYDNSTYLTGNQTITLTGDVTGSGATSIATTLANSGVTAGTYNGNITVDGKGRVTAATNISVNNSPGRSAYIVTTAAAANGFQISATRAVIASYSITIQATASGVLAGASSGYVAYQICPTNSSIAGDWVEVGRWTNGQTFSSILTLSSTQPVGSDISKIVPAGYYVRFLAVNVSGTPTYTYNSGQEVAL